MELNGFTPGEQKRIAIRDQKLREELIRKANRQWLVKNWSFDSYEVPIASLSTVKLDRRRSGRALYPC